LSSKPLTIAEKADGCGRVMIALNASGVRNLCMPSTSPLELRCEAGAVGFTEAN
jgi:hypothetical protein